MSKQKLFFSYSRIDGSAFAQQLASDLKKKGFDVWIDLEDIKAGAKWDKEIEKALENCDCLLFLETEQSVNSTNVLDEVYYALEQNKTVIPLIFVDSNTPFRLKRLQHIDFTKDYKSGLASLVKELGDGETAITFTEDKEQAVSTGSPSFFKKNIRLLILIACIAFILIAILLFTKTNSNEMTEEGNASIVKKDTAVNIISNELDTPDTGSNNLTPDKAQITNRSTVANETKKDVRANKVSPGSLTITPVLDKTTAANSPSNLMAKVAGSWRLSTVQPEAKSHQGYLKIEALEENKIAIKSYMQFYYPDSKSSSYLTVFNAFAGCKSCSIANEITLQAEDIAIGSRTIKIATEDQPDGQKAGDITLDASSNKSMRGTVTLQFPNSNTAVIKVRQARTITLAYDLLLQPFEYSFHFTKND